MKTLILPFLFSTSAFAASVTDLLPGEQTTFSCSFRGGMNYSYSIRVVQNQKLREKFLVVEKTLVIGTLPFKEKANESVLPRPGAPRMWTSKSFVLVVNFAKTDKQAALSGKFTDKAEQIEVSCR